MATREGHLISQIALRDGSTEELSEARRRGQLAIDDALAMLLEDGVEFESTTALHTSLVWDARRLTDVWVTELWYRAVA